jgi:hypothetical protein
MVAPTSPAFRLVDPNNPLVIEVVRYLQLWQDLHPLDLEDFRYGGTNITAFRLVDPNNPLVMDVIRYLHL